MRFRVDPIERLSAQLLAASPARDPVGVAGRLPAIQAQDYGVQPLVYGRALNVNPIATILAVRPRSSRPFVLVAAH